MPLLSITNLTTHPLVLQDPTGNSSLSLNVPASGSLLNQDVSLDQLEALEAQLKAQATASHLTYTVKDDPSSFADDARVPVVANSAIGTPQVYLVAVPDAASADYDITLPEKVEILDIVVQKRGGAGASGNTITVKSTASAITDVMDLNVADKVLVRPLTIDDANSTIVAAGVLRVSSAKSGGNAACLVSIRCVKRT